MPPSLFLFHANTIYVQTHNANTLDVFFFRGNLRQADLEYAYQHLRSHKKFSGFQKFAKMNKSHAFVC